MADVLLPLVWNGSKLAIPYASPTQDGYVSKHTFLFFSGGELVPVTSFNTRTGEVILLEDDVLAALGYVPQASLGYTPLNKAGDTMTGPLTMGGPLTLAGPPSLQLQAATKAYVDSGALLPGSYLASDFKASGSKNKYSGQMTSGSLTLTTTTVSDFQVGQGIYIAGGLGGTTPLITKVNAINGLTITLQNPCTAAVIALAGNVQHDDTVALQTAINTIVNAGGGVLKFPTPSFYRVNGPFTSINSILNAPYIPNGGTTSSPGQPTVPLTFEAEAQPFPAYTAAPPEHGCVIQSDKAATVLVSGYSILAFALFDGYTATTTEPFNNITFTCRNITWRTYNNPSISPLDLAMVSNCILENVLIDTGIALNNINTAPTHSLVFGLRLPRCSAGMAMISTSNVYIIGYDVGCMYSEMWRSTYIAVLRCNIGLYSMFGFHLSVGWALISECPTGVAFTNQSRVRFIIDFQPGNAGTPWATIPGHDLYDPSAGGTAAKGMVEYLSILSNVGTVAPITVTGCTDMTIVDLGVLH
jgi:hypothetical protein